MEGTSSPWRNPEVFSENRHPHSLQEVVSGQGRGSSSCREGRLGEAKLVSGT